MFFIYTIWSVNIIQSLWAVFGDFSRLGLQISKFAETPDTDLGWIGPVAFHEDVSYMVDLPDIMLTLMVIVYIASIVFFFLVRYQKD